eukprot:CAMPEP_0181100662 /NCGR_PEP_ID=MMETSP1071-20121207/13315_1 /TAXON_ID=35127 /ORGANISM="Thalassiosira sp., Strain NH16" /LENGTH=374 /DNA_ID=CAMNT_0023183411 /DNA_START=166 /DNA_END=1288 /DNA_ORIENTATION=-
MSLQSDDPNPNANDDDDDNAILRASLLRGSLVVIAAEADIRRSDEVNNDPSSSGGGGGGHGSIWRSPIETDYILRIECSTASSSSSSSLESYHLSKRYVDVRHLANGMRTHAEDIVRYYEAKQRGSETTTTATTGGGVVGGGIRRVTINNGDRPPRKRSSGLTLPGGRRKRPSAVFGALERALQKPLEAVQYLTNTEPARSNLASDLDSVFSDGGGVKSSVTELLDSVAGGTPPHVRSIVAGVDVFYGAIYSERRQFTKRTNYDHARGVAERRRGVMDGAFRKLMGAFEDAGCVVEGDDGGQLVPAPLDALVRSVERFLLTDVVAEEGKEEGGGGGGGPPRARGALTGGRAAPYAEVDPASRERHGQEYRVEED